MVLLSACQHHDNIRPSPDDQLVDFSTINTYQLSGKMSFSNGEDGGSGRIMWLVEHGLVDATLKAPLGSKSWQITESTNGAKLVTSSGEVINATDAESLISHQLGWSVPWQSLTAWILGKQHQNKESEKHWSGDTLIIIENGWKIVYSKFRPYPNGVMPHKMVAKKGVYSIKLAVKSWQW